MKTRGRLRIDPGMIDADREAGEVEVVVPYTDLRVTRAVLARATALTAGLNARVSLVAVHTVPYPATFGCPTAMHTFLVEQLVDLAGKCPLPVDAQVVLARNREDGFRYVLKPESTVLIGSRRRPWRTSEERLARSLAADGHKVALVHVE